MAQRKVKELKVFTFTLLFIFGQNHFFLLSSQNSLDSSKGFFADADGLYDGTFSGISVLLAHAMSVFCIILS